MLTFAHEQTIKHSDPIDSDPIDSFFNSGVAEFGVAAGELARSQCHPAVLGQLSQNLQEVCGQVYAQSLQTAMIIMACLYFGSALCFLLTWGRMGKDMVDRQAANPVTP